MLVILYNDRVKEHNGAQLTTDTFIKQAIKKLKVYGHERAFRIYWEVKDKYNEDNLNAFLDVPMLSLLFQHFISNEDISEFFDEQKVRADVKACLLYTSDAADE